ncbi:MAG: hypothetical protein J6T51_01960 [Kiritimatiellae bacterium]|nr:hypothetical protein [Kiritimatiellia bacterium]
MTGRVCMGVLCAAAVFGPASAGVLEVQPADFVGGGTPPGWTVVDGEYRSPLYSNAVDRIELRYSGASSGSSASLRAFPNGQGEGVVVSSIAAASSGASFDFPETTDFRSFSIAAENGFALSSFTAYVSANVLNAPEGVAISNNTTGSSFDASWNAVADATGYRVYVWTNAVVGASAGTAVWQETFANSPAKTTSTAFDVSYTDSGEAQWTFDKAYAHSDAAMVRIGNTSTKGVLVSPALGDVVGGGNPLMLRIRVWKQETKDGDFMPIGIVSEDVTNIVKVLEITTTPTDYHIVLPVLSATDRLAFLSPTNKASARAIVDDVTILSGYSEGHPEPSYIVDGLDVGVATGHSFSDLPSVPVQFAVEAYGRRGVSSAKTEAEIVDLSNPDKVAALNACLLSSLTSLANTYAYSQNFDSLAAITAETGDKEWLNGTTLPYWQAYKGGNAVTSCKYNGGSATSGALYALATSQSHGVRALGAYSTQNDQFSFGIAFTNDTDKTIVLASLAYLAQQWGFANTTNQTLSVSAKVVDNLDWISSYDDGWTGLASTESVVYGSGEAHDTPFSTQVTVDSIEGISIAPGRVLMLKWTIHSLKSGKPGMMGIDDVAVAFRADDRATRCFIIKIAGASQDLWPPSFLLQLD